MYGPRWAHGGAVPGSRAPTLCHFFLSSGDNNQSRFFPHRLHTGAGLDALSASLDAAGARAVWQLHTRSDRPVRASSIGFEATPVVDADHGESESRSRRRRGRCCGLWEKHKGNGVAPEGICAACRAAAHGASAAASWWAEAPHSRGSGLNASSISSSQNRMWLQHRPQRTDRNPASPRISTRVNHLASIGHTPHSSKFRAPKHILSPVLGSVYPIEWCAILR